MSTSRGSTPELKDSKKRRKKAHNFGADFIAFGPESGEEKASDRKAKKKPRSRSPPPEREWDKGKRREDRKRTYEMVFDHSESWNRNPERKSPWLEGLNFDQCMNVAEVLHKEVEAFTNYISPTPEEDELRDLTVQLITNAVKTAFPDAQVLPFGSYETKLYLPLGDIDLVVLSDSMAYSRKETVLEAIAKTIRRASIASTVQIIAKARVPLVKFTTDLSHIKVDMSINQPGGLTSGRIVRGFLKDMQSSLALRSLVLIIKAFLYQRNMNEVYTGGLGSYSIVCLVISFLQMHPKIRRGEIDPDKNLGVLVVEFFELYGLFFNYHEAGISVRDGGTYFSKKQRGWFDYGKPGALSIEDPADTSNDISAGSYGFAKVRKSFAGAFNLLTNTAYLRNGLLMSRRDRSSVKLRSGYRPEDLGVLSSILGITQETINRRALMQELYQDETLHKLLGVKPERKRDDDRDQKAAGSEPRSKTTRPDVNPLEQLDHSSADEGPSPARYHRQDDDDADRGRYDIGSSRPRHKRRRIGKEESDVHTVFTTDDEDDEHELHHRPTDRVDGSEGSRDVDGSNGLSKPRPKVDRKISREYWLNKGAPSG